MSKHSFVESLNSKERAYLKGLAHPLKPTVQIGSKGISEEVEQEISLALQSHQLIKVQLPGQSSAEEKDGAQNQLENHLPENAHVVARIGRICILFLEKKPDEATIKLPRRKNGAE